MSAQAIEPAGAAADLAAAPKTCLGCDYRLDHLTTSSCPECGRAFDPEDPATFGPRGQADPKWMWFMGVPMLMYMLCLFGITPVVRGWLPSYSISTTTTPWYFIVQDVASGLSLLPMLAVGLGLAYMLRRRHPWLALMLCWMSAIWSLGSVLKTAIILARCRKFLTLGAATAPWSSFDAYFWDPYLMAAQYGSLVLVLAWILVMTPRLRRWRQENLARMPRRESAFAKGLRGGNRR